MTNMHLMPFLRRVLLFDALTCVAMGVALLLLAATVEQMLAILAIVSRGAAVVLLVFGIGVAYIATRDRLVRPAVHAIVALNALWAVASVLALLFGWLTPNTPGQVFILGQALAVAIIVWLEIIALRRGAHAAI